MTVNTVRRIPRKRSILCILTLLSISILFFSCSPTRKLEPGQYLVERVELHGQRETKISKDQFEAFYRIKPNRKFLRVIPFFVWWYNLFDEEKIHRKKQLRNQRYDQLNAEKVKRFEKKNLRRAKKGKKPKIPRLNDKESPTFLESLRDIGEPASVLDSFKVSQTRFQLSKFLFSKGYFNNVVTDSIELRKKRKRAYIHYHIQPGPVYRVHSVRYDIEDSLLAPRILADSSQCLIKVGAQYDMQKLQGERQRLTDMLRNDGYYFFENAFTSYEVDTILDGNSVNVTINVSKFLRNYSSSNDSLIAVNHTRYRLANVYVITEPVIGNVQQAYFQDTILSKRRGIVFLNNEPFKYRPYLLLRNIDLYPGQWFRRDTAQMTYKALLGLGVFKNVIVQFFVNADNPNKLDCYILCTPLLKQSLSAETEGTNTSSNLGIDGSLIYQNRNMFKAGELVELSLRGSIVAQSQLRAQRSDDGSIQKIPTSFNTIQFGPELSFSVPRALFPFSLFPFRKDMAPRTYVKSAFNYQARPEFNRVITSVDYGFFFKTNNNTLRHDIIPFEVYFVRAQLTQQFKNTLASLNDAFLSNSFQDHVTTVTKYILTHFSKESSTSSRKTVHYVRWSVQSSGGILRKLFDVTEQPKDSLGRYRIIGIPFAHFWRTDIDYRIYIPVRGQSRIVYRVAGGIGQPLTNLRVLPYEQSFYSGGPNSVRAWRARTLGPGGYNPELSKARYDKIGDILLEGNIEYRFHIINDFNGALFVDAGNIWRLHPDESKPDGEFKLDSFIGQLAIGGGFGLRWDLNFFVLRLDMAMPLRDPKYAPGNRWTLDKSKDEKPWNNAVVNFGIGYPF